ncbi:MULTISPECIES: hypothetical protein [unclassified Microbacterium]|uniref:hypothetical protein n=1 Tax=unclassified Microbacterium TaxID=2609290 RepID=UPI001600EC92|nr:MULTISPECIES: hypothetical protein [unclassified Microbacterium]MBT2483369.1 hypothetical protein [Microbacterium sp. ISL-108]
MMDNQPSTNALLREQLGLLSRHADPSAVAALTDQLAASARNHPADTVARAGVTVAGAIESLAKDRTSTEARDRLKIGLRVLRIVSIESPPRTDDGALS